jgi:hypothetical protein
MRTIVELLDAKNKKVQAIVDGECVVGIWLGRSYYPMGHVTWGRYKGPFTDTVGTRLWVARAVSEAYTDG